MRKGAIWLVLGVVSLGIVLAAIAAALGSVTPSSSGLATTKAAYLSMHPRPCHSGAYPDTPGQIATNPGDTYAVWRTSGGFDIAVFPAHPSQLAHMMTRPSTDIESLLVSRTERPNLRSSSAYRAG